MDFPKPALANKALVELLKSRGLRVPDEAVAELFLSCVSFYRLKGYLLHFERRIENNTNHRIPPGISFGKIVQIYELDRKLRLLFFEAIEKIEISFRSNFINVYSLRYGPHWFLEQAHFQDGVVPGAIFQQRLIDRIKRSLAVGQPVEDMREQPPYIQHYFGKYTSPELPPSWMLAESLSLGVWSSMYKHLSSPKGAKTVAKGLSVPSHVLESWMHCLTVTRNFCAHHVRIWNRIFAIKPAVLSGHEIHFAHPARLYAQAFATAYLLRKIDPSTNWHLRFKETALTCPASEKSELGAPEGWETNTFWSDQPLQDISKGIPPATAKSAS